MKIYNINKKRPIQYGFIIGTGILAFILCFIVWTERNTGILSIYFLDIGQGDAIYIRTPNGNDMLIDSGPSTSVLRRLGQVMPLYDRSIDVLLETHPDQDHIGSFPDVIERYNISMFVMPGVDSKNSTVNEIKKLLAEKHIPVILGRRGMSIDFRDGVSFNILYPNVDPKKFETNTASIVGKLVYGSTSAMFTGDSPKSVEIKLVKLDGSNLKSDILKVGHHGSKTSSGDSFITKVNPFSAIISVGKNNRYGHPNKETVNVLEKHHIEILRTDEEGTIRFVSDGVNMQIKQKSLD